MAHDAHDKMMAALHWSVGATPATGVCATHDKMRGAMRNRPQRPSARWAQQLLAWAAKRAAREEAGPQKEGHALRSTARMGV